MNAFLHKIGAVFGALAAVLPAADALPGHAPTWLRVVLSVAGVISCIATDHKKVMAPLPPPAPPPGPPSLTLP